MTRTRQFLTAMMARSSQRSRSKSSKVRSRCWRKLQPVEARSSLDVALRPHVGVLETSQAFAWSGLVESVCHVT